MVRQLTFLALFQLLLVLVASLPQHHKIHNVPYHRQINGYSCGDASTEIVLHYSGPDVNQKAIIDVIETFQQDGTLSYMIARAGHFSKLSSAPSETEFPSDAPKNGWSPDRPLGLASFLYPRPQVNPTTFFEENWPLPRDCWIDELKAIVAQDIPVIALMKFQLNDTEGHFRVAIEYDNDSITFLDPWDRQGYPQVATFTNEDFCKIWDLTEPNGNVTYPPYFAAIAIPWSVRVQFDEVEALETNVGLMNVTAQISYPCPEPFLTAITNGTFTQYIASNVTAMIDFPKHMSLAEGSSMTIELGDLRPGENVTVWWGLAVVDSHNKPKELEHINVTASGVIQGAVPYDYWSKKAGYLPGYSYTDLIGGTASVAY